jgi:hypothetical protein
VRSVTVTFSQQVAISGNPFTLTRIGGGAVGLVMGPATLDGQGRTTVTLTFTGSSETDSQSVLNGGAASLTDGRYQLSIADGAVTSPGGALDGDGNGTAGGAYATTPDTAAGGIGQWKLYRLFGDADGNGTVDAFDVGQIRTAFNTFADQPGYLAYLDANNDGTIDAIDIGQFRSRFNVILLP